MRSFVLVLFYARRRLYIDHGAVLRYHRIDLSIYNMSLVAEHLIDVRVLSILDIVMTNLKVRYLIITSELHLSSSSRVRLLACKDVLVQLRCTLPLGIALYLRQVICISI